MAVFSGLAASNLAWPHRDFPAALALAQRLGLQGIEIAPYNVFGRWDAPDSEVTELRTRIEDAGMVCPSLQGILFNVPEATLFDGPAGRTALAAQLERVARIASLLGAAACVFGAPKQRDPGDLTPEQARDIAADFFRGIGPVFADHGTSLAFEANARVYGCRFITTTAQAVDFVRFVDADGISLQIDTGTIFLEGEDPSVLQAAAPLAAHAHVSEPQLHPIGTSGVDHRPLAQALNESAYKGFISIEMRAAEDWAAALEDAVGVLRAEYLA